MITDIMKIVGESLREYEFSKNFLWNEPREYLVDHGVRVELNDEITNDLRKTWKIRYVDLCIEDSNAVITFGMLDTYYRIKGLDLIRCLNSKSTYEFALKLMEYKSECQKI